jgi:hypothetical protein
MLDINEVNPDGLVLYEDGSVLWSGDGKVLNLQDFRPTVFVYNDGFQRQRLLGMMM